VARIPVLRSSGDTIRLVVQSTGRCVTRSGPPVDLPETILRARAKESAEGFRRT